MARVVLFMTCLLLGSDGAAVAAVTPAACTHWASPQGGGNGLSQASPFRVADFWAVARPGKTLCLLDGTYTGRHSLITVPPTFAGTASQPITIRALNDGNVFINGEDARPVHLAGAYGVLQGINAAGGANGTIACRGKHWVVQRVIGWSNRGGATILSMQAPDCQYSTLEDVAAWGKGRKAAQLGQGGRGYNTIRRGYFRFEECPECVSGNPTNTLELGYDQSNGTFENVVLNRNHVGTVTSPEGHLNAFSTLDSRILGAIAYTLNTDDVGSAIPMATYSTAGSHAGQTFTSNMVAKDWIAVVHPGYPHFKTVRGIRHDTMWRGASRGSKNTVDNMVSISGLPTTCVGADLTCTNLRSGTTVAGALAGTGFNTVWEAVPGACRRYTSQPGDAVSTLTTQGLWPWPMNQRIKDALRLSGRTPVDVTDTLQSLLGPIPPQCRGAGEGEGEKPPVVPPAPRNLHLLNTP